MVANGSKGSMRYLAKKAPSVTAISRILNQFLYSRGKKAKIRGCPQICHTHYYVSISLTYPTEATKKNLPPPIPPLCHRACTPRIVIPAPAAMLLSFFLFFCGATPPNIEGATPPLTRYRSDGNLQRCGGQNRCGR